MSPSSLSLILLDDSKAGEHEKMIVKRTSDVGLTGRNSKSIICLCPSNHLPNTRIISKRYRTPSQTTITRSTVDKPWAMGGIEGVGFDDIGHVRDEEEVVEVVVRVGEFGS